METKKICNTCGEEKPLKEFYTRKNTKDGRRGTCKNCYNFKRRASSTKVSEIQLKRDQLVSVIDEYMISEKIRLDEIETHLKKFSEIRENIMFPPTNIIKIVEENILKNHNFIIKEAAIRSKLQLFLNNKKNINNIEIVIIREKESFHDNDINLINVILPQEIKLKKNEIKEFLEFLVTTDGPEFNKIIIKVDRKKIKNSMRLIKLSYHKLSIEHSDIKKDDISINFKKFWSITWPSKFSINKEKAIEIRKYVTDSLLNE